MTSEPRRLLIVEDDPEMKYLLSVVLDEHDREIVSVATGAEALETIVGGDFDLVLLDLILPDLDGRTLLARLRERPETANTPVVVISARGGAEIREDCYDLGANAFIEKPFDPDEIAADIAGHLERSTDRERVSYHDPVTGLLNRAGLVEVSSELDAAYCVALVQLDGFLKLAESWGWSEAGAILEAAGGAVASCVEGWGQAARVGGGDFVILSSPADLQETVIRCEAVLETVRDVPIEDPDGETLRLTASIGVVAAEHETPLDDALEAARRRLFQAKEAGHNQVVAQDPEPDLTRARVLVAEDDEISATILLHRLQKEGLDVVRFKNGKEAYEAALDETPKLVILDVKMPGMDGFEVLERLRRTPAYAAVPIILLTSMGSEADVVRGFQLGADDYVLKPFSPTELSARVWRLLRRGRSASAV